MSLAATRPLIVGLFALISCQRGRRGDLAAPADPQVEQAVEAFVEDWLAPAGGATATVSRAWQAADVRGVRVRARPLRPEEASWNRWPDGTSRLFNNRAGWLVQVQVDGPHRLRWLPAGTTLEINEPGDPLRAARLPDALLRPLLQAALVQETAFAEGDLVDRTRAAGAWRAVYLPQAEQRGQLEGVVAFPTAGALPHVVGLRLTLALAIDDRPVTVPITWH